MCDVAYLIYLGCLCKSKKTAVIQACSYAPYCYIKVVKANVPVEGKCVECSKGTSTGSGAGPSGSGSGSGASDKDAKSSKTNAGVSKGKKTVSNYVEVA